MEASVAIIQHRSPCYSTDRLPSSPHDYDIIVLDEPSRPSTSTSSTKTEQNNYITKRSTVGNHAIGQTVIKLPYFNVNKPDSSLSESVLEAIYNKSRLQLARAVPVPLFDDRERQHRHLKPHVVAGTALMCVPVSTKMRLTYPYGRFENLARLVNLCLNTPELLDVRTRHMILRLDQWLSHSQCINPHFLASLFLCDSSKLRIIRCVHNPAYVHDSCVKYINKKAGSTKSVSSSIDLDEKVRVGNLARILMIKYNKYNILIMNPLFGLTLPNVEIPEYFILGSEKPEKANPTNDIDFALRYPLHNAALMGDQQTIRSLIAKNYDVNQRDRDGWTPLHYSCFYDQISATDALLTSASADVNMRNKGGATALHISSINGNPYITELLLSHPRIDTNICNNDGLRAIDLCATVPKLEHQQCARLMKETIKPEKIQIDLMDGGSLMVLLINGKDTKANEVLKQISQELDMSREALSLFGLWIYSDSLALQLTNDVKIWPKMEDWSKRVTKICRYEQLKKEQAKLMFRRNAQASLQTEIEVRLNTFTKSLLYEEVRQHFLAGRLPSFPTKTVVQLASMLTTILYGDKPKIEWDQLRNVLPEYILRDTTNDWKALILKALKKTRKTSSNVDLLQTDFLQTCRQFKIYGSTYFEAEIYKTEPILLQEQVWCAINDQGLHIISINQHILRASYDYIELSWTEDTWNQRKVLYVWARAHEHHFYIVSNQVSQLTKLMMLRKK